MPENVVPTYNSSTQKVTLTGAYNACWKGDIVTVLATGYLSPAHDNVVGHIYYLYYNGSTIQWATDVFP